MVQCMKIRKRCNSPYKQTEKEKPHNHLLRCSKGHCQIRTPLHDKSSGGIRNIRDITQHNKDSLQQDYTKYQLKRRETQRNITKIMNKKDCSFFFIHVELALEVLATTIRQLSEIKEIQIENEEV